MTNDLPNGIYFGLPEDQYHAIPRLSASGIKTLRTSALQYWYETLAPDREPEKETPAKKLGRAYHKLLLEGREAFEAAYAVAPKREDYPDALSGLEALKAKCEELDLKKSGTIAALSERIREADPSVQLWSDIMAEFEAEAGERERLTQDQWIEIERMAFVLEHMPSIKTAFTGGYPEVSILWTNSQGVKMKARLDYLKPRGDKAAILDIKTFGNVMNKPIEEVPATEIARNKYFIQPVVYSEAVKAAAKMYRQKGMDIIHSFGIDPDEEWCDNLFSSEDTQFHFVFAKTGGVPDLIAREFRPYETFSGLGMQSNEYWGKGLADYRYGVAIYRQCMERYGPDVPWVIDRGVTALRDEDFPLWALTNNTPDIEDEAA